MSTEFTTRTSAWDGIRTVYERDADPRTPASVRTPKPHRPIDGIRVVASARVKAAPLVRPPSMFANASLRMLPLLQVPLQERGLWHAIEGIRVSPARA